MSQEIELKNLKEPLISQDSINLNINSDGPESGLLGNLKSKLNLLNQPKEQEDGLEERIVKLDGDYHPQNINIPNGVCNQQYSLKNFIPLVLYHQFKYFFNLFFLVIALTQFVPVLQVGFIFTYVAPLIFVLTITLFKEAYDDIKRYKRDEEQNGQQYQVYKVSGQESVKSKFIEVGDIIEVNANQRVPADLILLYTDDPSGSVFIRTDQLDGETDWKPRRAVKLTQNYVNNNINNKEGPGCLINLNACVEAAPPQLDIYDFVGLFQVEKAGGNGQRESLNLESTMWCNTYLAIGKAVGLVIYTGKHTRSIMNSREPRTKVGRLDEELNFLSIVCFGIMVFLAALVVVARGVDELWILMTFRFILLFSSIIPISMRVNLDFAKITFSYKINNDKDIPDTVARNSQIPEELGRVHYVLSDQTGTLTQNDMIFKRLVLESITYTDKHKKALRKVLFNHCQRYEGPMSDVEERLKEQSKALNSINFKNLSLKSVNSTDSNSGQQVLKMSKRGYESVTRDLVTALCLCHNVTPVDQAGKQRTYQASSPDEVSLVKFAETLNMRLVSRTQNEIVLQNAADVEERYQILANFPFSSETKRMGIIVEHEKSGRIIFYLKGADGIMKHKIPRVQLSFMQDTCDDLAREGLRTLVITQQYIPKSVFTEWEQKYKAANEELHNRDQALRGVIELLESDMEMLGITGVEDQLQEDVGDCLEQLRQAGIAIWMLTGDKIETATCIAISTNLKQKTQYMYTIKEEEDIINLTKRLNEFNALTNTVLIIDGVSLTTALAHKEQFFFQVACQAPSVICCRCSPTQKATITQCVKQYTGKITLGIGDGGNDVGMIQAAHIGVGIVGQQGMQAALASDYSLTQFQHLAKLLLYHGRNAYKRTAVMSQFVIHRGMIISIIQAIFSAAFFFVAIPIYNGWLMLGYTTAYTMFPVFCLIFDEDVSGQTALNYPELYKTLLKGRDLNETTFFTWFFQSVYQGTVIMIMSLQLFQSTFIDIVTITYTSLIVAEILNVYSELNRLNWITVFSQLATLGFYFLTVYLFPRQIDMGILNWLFFQNVIGIVFVSWLPMHLIKWWINKQWPSDYMKIMRSVMLQEQLALEQAQQDEAARAALAPPTATTNFAIKPNDPPPVPVASPLLPISSNIPINLQSPVKPNEQINLGSPPPFNLNLNLGSSNSNSSTGVNNIQAPVSQPNLQYQQFQNLQTSQLPNFQSQSIQQQQPHPQTIFGINQIPQNTQAFVPSSPQYNLSQVPVNQIPSQVPQSFGQIPQTFSTQVNQSSGYVPPQMPSFQSPPPNPLSNSHYQPPNLQQPSPAPFQLNLASSSQ